MNNKESQIGRCAEALTEVVEKTANPEAIACLAHTSGEIALLRGNPDEAARQFDFALRKFSDLKLTLESMFSEYRLGVALFDCGENARAADHLEAALRRARNLGARLMSARIGSVMDRLDLQKEGRGSGDEKALTDAALLTRRQREILALISEGLTNKEVASRLHLSPRTVEMHVANALERLDCRSRSEAVKKAAESGMID